SCRAKTVAGGINRFGEGISRQDLKAMAQSLVDGCLQRVVVAVSAALDPKGNRLEPEKRDSFHRIGGRVGGQPIHRIGGTGKKRLIIASCYWKVWDFGASGGERDHETLVLLLNLQAILLNGRLSESRINRYCDERVMIPRVRRTGQHRTGEVGYGGRWGEYRERELQAGYGIAPPDQVHRDGEWRTESQGRTE